MTTDEERVRVRGLLYELVRANDAYTEIIGADEPGPPGSTAKALLEFDKIAERAKEFLREVERNARFAAGDAEERVREIICGPCVDYDLVNPGVRPALISGTCWEAPVIAELTALVRAERKRVMEPLKLATELLSPPEAEATLPKPWWRPSCKRWPEWLEGCEKFNKHPLVLEIRRLAEGEKCQKEG